jgi:FkbM family methyltransferase
MNINHLASFFQIVTVSGHSFMPHALNSASTVIDLGANRGEFCLQICDRFRPARCIAVEASPALAASLFGPPSLTVLHRAICDRDGPIPFYVSDQLESSTMVASDAAIQTSPATIVEGITLATLLRSNALSHIDLLKIDIEGAEVPLLLETPSDVLAGVAQITIEFHDFCNLTPTPVVHRMINRLKSLGFSAIRFSRNNTNWLFVNQHDPAFSPWRTSLAKFATSPLRRAKHRLLP